MTTSNKRTIQSRIEQLLAESGKLEAFKNSDIFQTSFFNSSSLELRLVKFHEVVTCYFQTEPFGYIGDSPSLTVKLSQSGRWKRLARHRESTFNRHMRLA